MQALSHCVYRGCVRVSNSAFSSQLAAGELESNANSNTIQL